MWEPCAKACHRGNEATSISLTAAVAAVRGHEGCGRLFDCESLVAFRLHLTISGTNQRPPPPARGDTDMPVVSRPSAKDRACGRGSG